MRFLFVFLSLFLTSLSSAQTALKKAENHMEKGKWFEAKELLKKVAKKDSASAELSVAWARWFFSKTNPSYQIDSAYHYCQQAFRLLVQLEGRSKYRLARLGLDSASLLSFSEKIDSTAFADVKEVNTERGYESFVQRFPGSKLRATAIELRDEVGFLEALKVNTYQSFERYIRLYPTSQRVIEARNRFDKLLFESKTKDRKLKSYVSFVREFPTSPFRDLADQQIFEIATARGDTSSFIQFVQEFPANKWKPAAIDWLFHFYIDYERKIPHRFLNDSLRKVILLNESYWAPILDKGKFGFINSSGDIAFAPRFETIEERYLCGSIFDDVLFTNEGLISRNGRLIFAHSSIQKSLGFGFYKVGDSTCIKVIHKSGRWVVKDCVQEVKLLGAHFFAVKQNGRWKLVTLTGRQLLGENTWDAIDRVEGVFVFSRLGKKIVLDLTSIESSADGNLVSEELVFDEVSRVAVDRLLVRNGSLEGLINSKLEFVVPFGRQTLSLRPFGLVRKVNDQYSMADLAEELEGKWWDNIFFSKQWLLLKRGLSHQLFDLNSKRIVENSDSCWFAGGLAFAKQKDSVRVHINSLRTLTFSNENRVHFVKSRDSVRYFYTESKLKKTVYDIATGQRLFTNEFEIIESFGEEIFLISRNGKRGLIAKTGTLVLLVEYEALVQLNDDYWSIYKDKKFGLFDWKRSRLVKPVYSRNISMLNSEVLIVFKDEHFGLTSWNGKALTAFEFDEMLPWTGDLVWVRKNAQWSLLDVRSGKVEIDRVKDFATISDTSTEKCMLIRRENLYGVISSERGIIIPTAFNGINNVGTDENPLYFTRKDVKEAQIQVVIYYDQFGKLIRKQVYEETEFEKIVCED
jgi:outer membrane protein assembly factor BamD (BamD/ComL family)